MNNKIVFVCGTLLSGGAERVIATLANAFVLKNYSVTIILWYKSEIFYDLAETINIIFISEKKSALAIVGDVVKFRHVLKEISPKVVISFMVPFNILTIWATFPHKYPIIVADRSDPIMAPRNFFYKILRNWSYRFAKYVVVQTLSNKCKFNNSIQDKIKIIPNPIFIDQSLIEISKSIVNRENRIVSVGRLIPSKNQLLIIKAFANIIDKYKDYTLHIYGDGELRKELQLYIEENNLAGRVFLEGVKKEIIKEIYSAKLFVMTSLFEGMPNSLFEAMAIGLPVISTKVSGAVDYIKDEKNGLLIDFNNLEELQHAMEMVLDNVCIQKKLSNNAIEINKELNINVILKQWFAIIN